VPVDGATLGFDESGRLKVLSAPGSGNVPNPLPAVDGAALTNVNASALRGAPIDGATPTVGQVLKWSGAAWSPAADTDTDTTNPGTVTSIVAGSGLTGGTITGSGTLAVDTGTGANQIVRLDASSKLPAVDASALTGVNAVKLQAVDVDPVAPSASQVLKYDGTKWAPATDANSGGTVTSITAGSGLTGGTITGSGTIALTSPMPALDGGALTNVNAVKIQGRTVGSTTPSNGHVLKWNASASAWDAAPDDGGVAGAISSGQSLGLSDSTTADIYESTSAPNMRFRRLKEGSGVALTQNADDVTVAVAAGGISAAELAVDAVGSDEIAADAVGSVEIAAGAVANSELAADAVTSVKIQDGQVQTADLAADAITTAEILNGTITGADVSSSAALSVASVGVAAQAGLSLAPFGVAAGNTGEARFRELTAGGSNFVALKAPDALAADVTFTLPDAAPSVSGQVLSGTTAGGLSWSTLPSALPPSGAAGGSLSGSYPNPTFAASSVSTTEITDGTIADADISGSAAIATSKLSGAITQVAGHGLGALATASTVTTTEITDGSIVNADISSTAAIATSKLSGPVTSISGHGLGALATLSAVGSTEITDGQVANVDISGSAAIATSKLSGPVTSIAGHGLGPLATLSSVASAQIADGTITDADISGSAAISSTKISFAADSISGNSIDGGIVSNFQSTGIDDNSSAGSVTIAASGDVGIGTTAPSAKLHVDGDAIVGNKSTISLTRTMPTVINDTVDLGSFTVSSGAVSMDISVVVSNASFSVAKRYIFPLKYNQTANTWTVAQPISDSGPWVGTQDYALDVNVNNGVSSLRLRRTLGSVAGTAYVTIQQSGRTDTTFTASTATASVTAPSTLLGTANFGSVAGNVGIGTSAPTETLHVAGNITLSGEVKGGEGWTTVGSLSNGWIPYSVSTPPVRYLKDKLGYVHLQGGIKNGACGTVFTLPVGYRPAYNLYFPNIVNGGGNGYTLITSAGVVSVELCNSGFTDVGGGELSFKAEN
jgi:hypothetical protein